MKIRATEIQQYADGRWGFDDYSSGERIRVRCKTKRKATERAGNAAVLSANGRNEFAQFDPLKWQRFLKWDSVVSSSPPVGQACESFIALKSKKSSRYIQTLGMDLKLFERFIGPTKSLAEVTALEIQRFLDSREVGERRRYNLRASVVSLFRWARRMSLLDGERTTEAEKVDPIEKTSGQPNILSPDQMRTLLDNVRPEFLPWLAIAGFAGVRSQEISPDYRSKKSPLQWEDFDWRHKVIIVRAETAKTKEEREVPISSNLAEWLAPWRRATGQVCSGRPCNHETRRLGAFIGGWQHNALRDSYCSYRTRITQNVPATSYELGNSIQMVKRSYHRRQPIQAAREWFKIRPVKDSKVIAFKRAA